VSVFKKAQLALDTYKSIMMPRLSKVLWVFTDSSIKNRGIATTPYFRRSNKLLLAGFFIAKLRKIQATWLPYEIEALSIGSAIKQFDPIITRYRDLDRQSPVYPGLREVHARRVLQQFESHDISLNRKPLPCSNQTHRLCCKFTVLWMPQTF